VFLFVFCNNKIFTESELVKVLQSTQGQPTKHFVGCVFT